MSKSDRKRDDRGAVWGDLVHVRGIDPEADRAWDEMMARQEEEQESQAGEREEHEQDNGDAEDHRKDDDLDEDSGRPGFAEGFAHFYSVEG